MSEKFIGLVGLGYWGQNILRNLYDLGALHTACDADEKEWGTAGQTGYWFRLLLQTNIAVWPPIDCTDDLFPVPIALTY